MSFRTSRAVESSSSSSPYSPQSCRQFSISEIEAATQNFDESLVIGRGGFGKVYRGTIACGEICLDAAIKRLESTSNQGAVEFWAEVEMLSKLRHCHLVSLIGYCNERREMILVYDYMSNGTLADRLHKRRASLTWVRRLKICIGAARGLDYLHTGTGIKHGVIHRDVKSTNILLDDNWAAKISDFGLSKIGPTNQPSTYVNTFVRGTFGYMDPDYFQTGKLTRKSDVYAFGVVLFEVLCAKQAVDRSIDEEHWGLATWAQDSIKEGRLKQIIDSKLRGKISPKCLKDFALLADRCLHSHPKQRPTMAEVVVGLESILALQEKTDSELLIKLSGRRVPTFLFPFNRENSALKSLDLHLYTVGGEDRIVHRFDFNTIVYATEHFSEAKKISSYGYKSMYKGKLQNGQDVTITQYSDAITYEECMNEASILVKLEHENVIELLGYCIYGTNVYLLYDFALNATLAGLIFDPMCNLLDWNQRYKIILGVARVLVYLHNAPVRMIHGQVNPENILLDESFNPKLSCFSLATAINESDSIHVDWHFGTMYYGYMAPELLFTKYLSTKADVFSFGALVLETVTGQRICDFKPIAQDPGVCLDYVQRNWLEDTLSGIVDPRIDVDSVLTSKFIKIGLLCVQEIPEVRPTMEEVVGMFLGTFSPTLPLSRMQARMNGGDSTVSTEFSLERNNLVFFDYGVHNFDMEDLLKASTGLPEVESFGTSYRLILEEKSRMVAVKRLKDVTVTENGFKATMEVLGKVKNKNVVPLIAYYCSKYDKLLVYDRMPASSLFAHLHGSIGWDHKMGILLSIAKGLAYLHVASYVVHGNIKPSNIFIQHETNNYEAYLSDYGLNMLFDESSSLNNEISAYQAPEVRKTCKPTFQSDVYSFGVLLVELLTGKYPRQATYSKEEPSQLNANKEGVQFSKLVESVVCEEPRVDIFYAELLQIAKDCVSIMPDQRPTMQNVLSKMEDMWLRHINDHSKGYDYTPSTETRDTPSTITL